MKEKAPKFYTIKTKVSYEVVIEAADKDEAAAWAEQVLPEIVKLDISNSPRVRENNREITIKSIKKVKSEDGQN